MKGLMMLIAVVFLGMSQGARADFDCYRRLLNDFSSDSSSFQIYDEDVAIVFEEAPEKAAVQSIRLLEKKLECDNKAIRSLEVSCKDVVPDNLMSRVCYVESNEGYFIMSMDMMENVNLVFNRWD